MTWISTLPICLGVLAAVGCSTRTGGPLESRQTKRELLAEQTAQAEYERAVQDLVSRYGAARDWERSVGPSPFTIELQRALGTTSGGPVVVRAELNDIAFSHTENRYVATFTPGFRSWLQFTLSSIPSENSQSDERPSLNPTPIDVIYRLECTEKDANRLLAARQGSSDEALEFALIARITSVGKIGFRVNSDHGEEFSEVTIEHPDQFLAHGSLLDFTEAPRISVPQLQPEPSP